MKGNKLFVYKAILNAEGDRDYAKRVADEAERRKFVGYEMIIIEGKSLFLKDIKNL